jgi:hypothetical protein
MKAKVNSEKGYSKKELMKIIEKIDEDRRHSAINAKTRELKSDRQHNG